MKIYKCPICGNIVELVVTGGGMLVCCGVPMQLLEANTVDAAVEKHIPVVTFEDGFLDIKVGEVMHPQTKEHYIDFLYVVYGDKHLRIKLAIDGTPTAKIPFTFKGEVTVYAYCNLHGLWMTKKEI